MNHFNPINFSDHNNYVNFSSLSSHATYLPSNPNQSKISKIINNEGHLNLNSLKTHVMLDAPILYELAISEFILSPTAETVAKISLPLIAIASFRVEQDEACFFQNGKKNDSIQEEIAFRMEINCKNALKKAMKVHAPSLSMKEIETLEVTQSIDEQVKEIAQHTLDMAERLPNPRWICWYHTLNTNIKMHSENMFVAMRCSVALKKLSE